MTPEEQRELDEAIADCIVTGYPGDPVGIFFAVVIALGAVVLGVAVLAVG